jgi:hypothetical protein
MSEFTDQPETDRGRALFEELLWVHRMVRRDLETVRRLADECLEGRPAEELAGEIRKLEANGPLWRLKVNCLRCCRFVHSHHGPRSRCAASPTRSSGSLTTSSPTSATRRRTCGQR